MDYTILPYGNYVDGHLVYLNVGTPVRTSTGTTVTGGSHRLRSGIWIFNTQTLNLYHHMGLGEYATNATEQDFGHALFRRPGTVIKGLVADAPRLFASADVYTGGATFTTGQVSALYREEYNKIVSNDANRGYFITPYIPVADIDALWEGLWLKFKRFVHSNNRIIVKWRTIEAISSDESSGLIYGDRDDSDNSPLQKQGTWVSTTTFTCAVPTGADVGDEVEILNGDNAGCSFDISALSATPDGSTTITVTISEATPRSASTDTFLCRFENWNSETAISLTSIGNKFVPLTANGKGEFIQFKVELRGYLVEIDDLIPKYKVNTEIQQQ